MSRERVDEESPSLLQTVAYDGGSFGLRPQDDKYAR